MASKKRTRPDIRTYFDKENLDPENVSSPPRKKRKSVPGFQTQTRSPLGAKDTNGSSSLLDKPQPRSVDSSVKEQKRTTGEEGLKQDQKAELSEESPESIFLSTDSVDKYFPKIYKPHSPRTKQLQTLEIPKTPGDFKLEVLNLSDRDVLSWLKEIGIAVCKIIVHDGAQGTGMSWCGRCILTNAHLFKDCIDGKKLLKQVSVGFDQKATRLLYTVKETFVDIDEELDYAVVELIPKNPEEELEFPPGLLKRLGPVPKSGRVGLIGYPEGEEKTFRHTPIIEPENRERAMNDHLAQYNDLDITKESVKHLIMAQGISDLMTGGIKEKWFLTYHTSMYGGTSGSPVIDGSGRLIGLHTGGYDYGFPKMKTSVFEFASPLGIIFKRFVSNLKKNGEKQLLERIIAEVSENVYINMLMLSDEWSQ